MCNLKMKKLGWTNDLNEEIESAVRASWGKLFHKDTADGTKDEQNAFVRAYGWWSKGVGTTELCVGKTTLLGK